MKCSISILVIAAISVLGFCSPVFSMNVNDVTLTEDEENFVKQEYARPITLLPGRAAIWVYACNGAWICQVGPWNWAWCHVIGGGNYGLIYQEGDVNIAAHEVYGSGNFSMVTQRGYSNIAVIQQVGY